MVTKTIVIATINDQHEGSKFTDACISTPATVGVLDENDKTIGHAENVRQEGTRYLADVTIPEAIANQALYPLLVYSTEAFERRSRGHHILHAVTVVNIVLWSTPNNDPLVKAINEEI